MPANSNNTLKIGVITSVLPPLYGGADIAAFRYSKALMQSTDYQVKLIGEWNSFLERKVSDNLLIPVHLPKMPRWNGYLRYFSDYFNLITAIISVFFTLFKTRKDYNIIHSFNSSSDICAAAILSGKILGIPVITETSLMNSDDPVSLLKPANIRNIIKAKWLKGRIFLLADRYISKSPYISTAYHKMGLMSKCKEIPYFIDTAKFYPASKEGKKVLRQKHKLPEDAQVILYVGGINPRKGVHLLVDAFRRLMIDHPSVFLLLVGPTDKYNAEYTAGIKKAIHEIGPYSRLIEGNSTIVDEYMRAADIYCLPSFREGFPISNIEAMASGLVVVASDIPEIKNTQIRDRENGLTFSAGSSEDLYTILKLVLEDSGLQQTLVNTAVAEARLKYSLTVIQQQYLDVYQSVNS